VILPKTPLSPISSDGIPVARAASAPCSTADFGASSAYTDIALPVQIQIAAPAPVRI